MREIATATSQRRCYHTGDWLSSCTEQPSPLTCHFTFLIWRSRVRSPAAAKFIRINLIRNSNLSSFQICHTRNLFRQQKLFLSQLSFVLFLTFWLWSVLFFNIATHSDFGATCEASKTDIVSTVVCVNGILRWTVTSSGAYLPRTPSRCEKNPEMNTTLRCGNVRSLSTCTVIVCKCLAIKNTKKRPGLAHI